MNSNFWVFNKFYITDRLNTCMLVTLWMGTLSRYQPIDRFLGVPCRTWLQQLYCKCYLSFTWKVHKIPLSEGHLLPDRLHLDYCRVPDLHLTRVLTMLHNMSYLHHARWATWTMDVVGSAPIVPSMSLSHLGNELFGCNLIQKFLSNISHHSSAVCIATN